MSAMPLPDLQRMYLAAATLGSVACASAPPVASRTAEQAAYTQRLATEPDALGACVAIQQAAAARAETVFVASEVDSAARLPSFRASGTTLGLPPRDGDVAIAAIVRRTGRVDARTLRVVRATDAEFADSARAYLRRVRFAPALRHGAPVDQCTVTPFTRRTAE